MKPRMPLAYTLLTLFLAAVATLIVDTIIWRNLYHSMSEPKPVAGPMRTGWSLTVLAMEGGNVVELDHEWAGVLRDRLGEAATDSSADQNTKAAERAKHPDVVWADTGKANRPLRYYLTPEDVRQANSQFDTTGVDYRDVQVKVLNDDATGKHQVIEVKEYDENDDVCSIYRVENGAVRPLLWSRCRPLAIAAALTTSTPVTFVVFLVGWRWVLRRRFVGRDGV